LVNKYTKGGYILHPKFGKGIIASVEGSRVIVLFADGTKKLGHGRTAQPLLIRPTFDIDTATEPGDVDADPAAALAHVVLAHATESSARAEPTDAEPAPTSTDTESH
jgi:hypothetical protein